MAFLYTVKPAMRLITLVGRVGEGSSVILSIVYAPIYNCSTPIHKRYTTRMAASQLSGSTLAHWHIVPKCVDPDLISKHNHAQPRTTRLPADYDQTMGCVFPSLLAYNPQSHHNVVDDESLSAGELTSIRVEVGPPTTTA